MEEQQTEENGVLVLEPVRRDHSGIYQCQGLDLETTISLQSDPQELLVNCEAQGCGGSGWGCIPPVPPTDPMPCPQTCLMST